MKRTVTLFFVLVISSSVFSQSVIRNIMHDGIQREYRIYVPAVYDGTEAVPLLFNLHGYTSNGFQQEIYGDFRPVADTANFILVHPEGTLDLSGTNFWNAFGSPNETVDDVGFISALIDSVSTEYNIDANRVYSTGMSNGGFMSYKLACELSSRIAAIASVTGSMPTTLTSSCSPGRPVPVMQIHGTADPTVPYLGNPLAFMESIADVVDYWVANNNCNTTAIETSVPDTSSADLCTTDHFVYAGGDAGSSVELYRVNGGAHTWPGSHPDFVNLLGMGVTSWDFSACGEIWRFFSQYRLNELVGVEDDEDRVEFSVYPNPSSGVFQLMFEDAANRLLVVRNTLGQLVYSNQISSQFTEIEITNTGVYLLTVEEEGVRRTKKLVVE